MFWLEHSKALEWTDEMLMMQVLAFVFYQHVMLFFFSFPKDSFLFFPSLPFHGWVQQQR